MIEKLIVNARSIYSNHLDLFGSPFLFGSQIPTGARFVVIPGTESTEKQKTMDGGMIYLNWHLVYVRFQLGQGL